MSKPMEQLKDSIMKIKNKQNIITTTLLFGLVTVLVACSSTPPTQTQTPVQVQTAQVPIPKTAADVPGPAAGNTMTKEYVQTIGRMAYVWGWPLVNSHNRRAAFAYVTSQNGNVPGWNGGVLPMAPVGLNSMLTDYIKPEQTFVACPNQDVVYGDGFLRSGQRAYSYSGAGFRRSLLGVCAL